MGGQRDAAETAPGIPAGRDPLGCPARGRRAALASGRALLVGAAVVTTLLFVWLAVRPALQGALRNDPTAHYDLLPSYFGAVDLAAGANPYDLGGDLPSKRLAAAWGLRRTETIHAPMVLAQYLPLALLDPPAAKVAWLGAQVALLAWCTWLLACLASPRPSAAGVAAVVLLVTTSATAARGLAVGQADSVVLALLALGVLWLERGHERRAGALLALAGVYKINPGLALAGPLLRRQWRPLLGAALAAALACGLSVALFGLAPHLSWLRQLRAMSGVFYTWWANQGLQGLFARLLAPNPYSRAWVQAPYLAGGLWVGSSAALALVAGLLTRRARASAGLNVALWLVVGLLVAPRSWDHYMIWGWIPIVLAARQARAARRGRLLVVLVAAAGLLAYPGMFWAAHPAFHAGPLLLLTSSQTAGLLLLFGALAWLHRADAGGAPQRGGRAGTEAPGALARAQE